MSPALDILQYGWEPQELPPLEPAGWNLPLDHISASMLSTARLCPYKAQQRYIWKQRERPGESMVTGSVVHAGLEWVFKQKELELDVSQVELVEYMNDAAFPSVIEREQQLAGEEILYNEGSGPDQVRRRSLKLASAYHLEVVPRITPTAVEESFSVEVPGIPVPLVGRMDVITEGAVIDIKTGQRKTTKAQGKWLLQAGIYSAVCERPIEFHSLTATAKTGVVSIVTPLEYEAMLVNPSAGERRQMWADIEAIVAELCSYMDTYGTDQPWPTHGKSHDWACDWCGFRNTCPAWED